MRKTLQLQFWEDTLVAKRKGAEKCGDAESREINENLGDDKRGVSDNREKVACSAIPNTVVFICRHGLSIRHAISASCNFV
jgi:hypothetical protein